MRKRKARTRRQKRRALPYVGRMAALALLTLPIWTAVPFLARPSRLELLFSGTVPPERVISYLAVSFVLSFAMCVYVDWDLRREARKAGRD